MFNMVATRLSPVVAASAALCFPRALYAQFTDARTYSEGRVGLNSLEFTYAYVRANASIDTSLVVGSANLGLNKGTLSYTHNFGMFGQMAWVTANVPFASLEGSVAAGNTSGSTSGMGDSSLELAVLLKGGRALSAADLATYTRTLIVGMSLTVGAPTGQYDGNKVLNLGSHRWSFKPELGISYPFGAERKWEVDGYINVYFFTDNTAFQGMEILHQEPLPGVEAHLSYSVTPSLWVSLDTRYAFRGETVVDGLEQNNPQENLILGAEASWAPDSHNSLDIVFAKALVHKNAPAFTGVSLSYIYSWSGGHK
jgi:hypothetical protein